ncbi:hypothetical protein H6F94_20950 [Leptolyngbya sp. FACHB-261]|nr:hypothetical protein [Leptolyngbya sp. FACHB-261]
MKLSKASTKTVTVAYATANGTATGGSDYQGRSGSLTFNPGETQKAISIPVIGDTRVEANETLLVNLSKITNATLADAQGRGVISTDDPVNLSGSQTLTAELTPGDRSNPTLSSRHRDDYRLTGVSAGRRLRLNLDSTRFNPYLQLVNASTGQVLAANDNANGGLNSQLFMTVQSGVNYLIRVTSASNWATGSYTLRTSPA